jgi:5'-nucleotidase
MKILIGSFVLNCVIFTFISYFTNGFNLVIVHTNDVHAHIEQMNAYTSACKKTDEAKGKCYGGISRRVTKVKELRSQYDNVILLDAGDQYQGSLWFNIFKGREAALLMNKLKYDAMVSFLVIFILIVFKKSE